MSDRKAHIAACISVFDEDAKVWRDTRGDDTPRLVYADWLEENGEPERAEFLRVQVELANRGDRLHNTRQPGIGVRRVCKCGGYPCESCNELRRRERELLLLRYEAEGDDKKIEIIAQWKRWWNLPPNEEGYYLLNVGDTQNQQGIGILPVRGWPSVIRCSWADWLRVESRLVWVPGATVECGNCEGAGEFTRENSDPPYGPCPNCGGHLWSGPYFEPSDHGWDKGSGRIPRPFYESMHPVEMVELTGWLESSRFDVTTETTWLETREGHRFDREKCQKCGGTGETEYHSGRDYQCPCGGRPINSWRCDSWPMQRFLMPEVL